MIRKIPIARLVPGMYVADLHQGWLEHSLWRRRFLVRDEAVIRRLIQDGVAEVSIDTARGIDLPLAQTGTDRRPEKAKASAVPGQSERLPTSELVEELRRAAKLQLEATRAVRGLMDLARATRLAEAGRLEPIVARMIESVRRHPDALPPLARFRRTGDYAADHAVATAALVVALALNRRMEAGEMEKLAFGTLVKDIGQVFLDGKLTGRPGKLSQEERSKMQGHVEEGLALLKKSIHLPEMAVMAVSDHHERFDGSGYPCAKAGQEISLSGRMAAIVDAYDAMTSDRPYRRALSPATALRRVYRGGGRLFDAELAAGFARAVGIYPVGSLVRLESGHLGVVEEVHRDDLLRPVVRVIYHAGRRHYIKPVRVDLACRQGNDFGRIIATEEFAAWGINPRRWQAAESIS